MKKPTTHATPSPTPDRPRRISCTARSCFSGGARKPTTSATAPIPKSDATIKKNKTRYSSGVGFLPGPVTIEKYALTPKLSDAGGPQRPDLKATYSGPHSLQ